MAEDKKTLLETTKRLAEWQAAMKAAAGKEEEEEEAEEE